MLNDKMDKNIKEMIEYPKEGILSKQIVKTKKTDVTLFCMAKNSGLDEHTSTKQAVIYVVEGKGIFNLNNKKIKMLPGVFIFMKENAIHSLKAEENTTFILSLV